jgi:ribosomal protein S18 acetylase RimI-like enzyme
MEHILDNPAWNAMISHNSHLALGNEDVRYFPEELSPFAGIKHPSGAALLELQSLLPADRIAALVIGKQLDIPPGWKVLFQSALFQLTCENFKPGPNSTDELVLLEKEHVPQMLALTKLTNPGPFSERTIQFGHYEGIFSSGKLVAMGGQRLHAFQYAEISAVCTHPEHLGKGYGSALVSSQAKRIINSGEIPFLHVRKDNLGAIKLYRRLGFEIRKEMHFYVIQRLA